MATREEMISETIKSLVELGNSDVIEIGSKADKAIYEAVEALRALI